jgi:molecular chaperone DnaJ
MSMRVAGSGAEGTDGYPPGDLFVQLEVAGHQYFKRNEANITVEVAISMVQAVLGGTVEVKTLDGTVEMKIPPGTQPNAQMVIKGKGVKLLNSDKRSYIFYVFVFCFSCTVFIQGKPVCDSQCDHP